MKKAIKDGLIFGLFGTALGAMVGVIGASAYVTIKSGRRFEDVELLDIFKYAPWITGSYSEPFQTGSMIIAAAAVIGSIAFIALSFQSILSSHGTARWATKEDLRNAGLAVRLKNLSGPIYAKLGNPASRGEFITSHDIPHSFICAPTGSGKGVGVVIPTLLTYGGSVICLDIKGENYEATARARVELGDKVYRFSPLDPDGRSHRFNPLEKLAKLPSERRFTEAQRIAESFIVMAGDNVQGFLVSAKQIFAATVLVAVERHKPTMASVYDILSEGGDFNKLFAKLAKDTNVEEAKSIYQRMAGISDRTLSAYMSILFDGGLGIWRDGFVRAATESSDFKIDDLRRNPASIYIVVSPNDLAVLAPMIRLLFQQTIAILQSAEPSNEEPYPVLFLLDEFPQLGRMTALSGAISTIRGYGGRIMIVAQSLSSLRGTYGHEGAQNFLANCRMQLFMAPADSDTPDYVSKAIGNFTRKSRSKSWTMGQLGKSNIQEREEGAQLIRPEQLRNLSQDDVILLIQNTDPIRAQKVRYYEDKYLRPIFEGQVDALPLPPKLAVRTSFITSVKNTAIVPSRLRVNGDDNDIPDEEFERQNGSQSILLEKIRAVKSSFQS
ncbi:MAG: type IV secretion system ATPase VirD4 [Rhizobiaceae bacterium]